MNYAELKEIALKKEVVILGGRCEDQRHGEPEPSYIIPVYHEKHSIYGECVIIDEELGVILNPGETLYDINASIGCCCIHTVEKVPDDPLKGVIQLMKLQGVSLEDFIEKVKKAW
jgi:hypothetical protein